LNKGNPDGKSESIRVKKFSTSKDKQGQTSHQLRKMGKIPSSCPELAVKSVMAIRP
jgi:hypothetical protein